MQTDRLIILGSKGGPAVRSADAMPTSNLLQIAGKTFIIDCGIGVTRAIVASGVALSEVDAVFITHLHSDHVLELGPLLHTLWTSGLGRSLPVYGPAGSADYWRHFLASMAFDNAIRIEDEGRPDLESLVELTEFGEGQVARIGEVEVSSLRVLHPPVDECYALKIRANDKSVVFSADTAHFQPLAAFASGCDVLVHEAMLAAGVNSILKRTPNAERLRQHLEASHSTVAEAADIANQAGTKHLVLNHLIPADDPEIGDTAFLEEASAVFDGKVTVGRDGLEVPL